MIEISTRTQGETQLFRAAGTLERRPNGAISVRYVQETDAVTLTFSDRAFLMRREGETGLSARFLSGKRTAMEMRLGSNLTEIPCYTEEYRFGKSENTLRAKLRYRLFSGNERQNFELIITIGYSEEK